MSRHSIDTSVEIILHRKSVELVATVAFNYSKATPDFYDKSLGAWLPGDGEEIEPIKIIDAQIDGMTAELPPWLADLILENMDDDAMREKAFEDAECERDRAMEYSRGER
jgi:hypothetical protein